MGQLFKALKKGLKEIIAHQEGKLTLKSEFIEIPEFPKKYNPKKIKHNKIK